MVDLLEAFRLEKKLGEMLTELKESLFQGVRAAPPMEGVTEISKKPFMALVRFSALKGGWNLAPETYLQESQANAVKRRLQSCGSTTAVIAALRDMLNQKKIRMDNKYWVVLNESTLAVLDSVLPHDNF